MEDWVTFRNPDTQDGSACSREYLSKGKISEVDVREHSISVTCDGKSHQLSGDAAVEVLGQLGIPYSHKIVIRYSSGNFIDQDFQRKAWGECAQCGKTTEKYYVANPGSLVPESEVIRKEVEGWGFCI